MAMEALLTNWIEARQEDNYKLSKVDYCINIDEAKELIEKLNSQISYEKIWPNLPTQVHLCDVIQSTNWAVRF